MADNRELVISRILTAVVAEALRIESEGVAGADDIDRAMQFGALFKKPPFAYAKEKGKQEIDAVIKKYF
ncbi:MAG TPA: 3-hydroxyacyl-CoA dehydrogenase family protein [bacterium]|nr:3-hydroxyacyl-CoA dehydrogenase family protein [bacterium]